MKHWEGDFQGAGNLTLYTQGWDPEDAPRAILAIVHGLGEHSGRYGNIVNGLIPRHYSVYGYDHRGHGRSQGQRGHILSWAEYRNDLRHFLQMIKERQPGRPTFLLGHSMGALIVLDYIMRNPEGVKGAIVSGSPIKATGATKSYLIIIAWVLSRVWPGFSLDLGLDKSAISRDPTVVKAYEEDPLVHGKATPRWGTEFMATAEWVKGRAAEIKMPLLMLHGETDRLSLAEGARQFFEQIPFPDKELHIYPGSYHEPHNDLDSRQVISDLEAWVARHL